MNQQFKPINSNPNPSGIHIDTNKVASAVRTTARVASWFGMLGFAGQALPFLLMLGLGLIFVFKSLNLFTPRMAATPPRPVTVAPQQPIPTPIPTSSRTHAPRSVPESPLLVTPSVIQPPNGFTNPQDIPTRGYGPTPNAIAANVMDIAADIDPNSPMALPLELGAEVARHAAANPEPPTQGGLNAPFDFNAPGMIETDTDAKANPSSRVGYAIINGERRKIRITHGQHSPMEQPDEEPDWMEQPDFATEYFPDPSQPQFRRRPKTYIPFTMIPSLIAGGVQQYQDRLLGPYRGQQAAQAMRGRLADPDANPNFESRLFDSISGRTFEGHSSMPGEPSERVRLSIDRIRDRGTNISARMSLLEGRRKSKRFIGVITNNPPQLILKQYIKPGNIPMGSLAGVPWHRNNMSSRITLEFNDNKTLSGRSGTGETFEFTPKTRPPRQAKPAAPTPPTLRTLRDGEQLAWQLAARNQQPIAGDQRWVFAQTAPLRGEFVWLRHGKETHRGSYQLDARNASSLLLHIAKTEGPPSQYHCRIKRSGIHGNLLATVPRKPGTIRGDDSDQLFELVLVTN